MLIAVMMGIIMSMTRMIMMMIFVMFLMFLMIKSNGDLNDDHLKTLLMMISLLSFCTLIKLNLNNQI